MGIVSAVGRNELGINQYENFIQTDAAINPGNSGGALVDAEGRLVGINTAIFSESGGYQGVGFAVPVSLARSVMERLIKYGKVTRGYLGVDIQSLTPELAEEFSLPDQKGALVTEVQPNTPAGKAGLMTGDVIRQVDGKSITDSQQLRLMISQTAPCKGDSAMRFTTYPSMRWTSSCLAKKPVAISDSYCPSVMR